MKKYKIIIMALGISLFGSAWAQSPVNGNISVCLKGNGNNISGQALRMFTVSISGDRDSTSYMELANAVEAKSQTFTVTNPKSIKVVEPKNPSFSKCETKLDKNIRSIEVMINFPADFRPFCTITSSSSTRTCSNH